MIRAAARAARRIAAAITRVILWDHERYIRALEADFKANGIEPTKSLIEFYRQADAMRCRIAILEQ